MAAVEGPAPAGVKGGDQSGARIALNKVKSKATPNYQLINLSGKSYTNKLK